MVVGLLPTWDEPTILGRGTHRLVACKLTCCRPLCVPGASVINTRCSETYRTWKALSLFGIPLWYHSQSPRVILQVGTLATRPHRGGRTGRAGSCVGLVGFIGFPVLLQASGQVDAGGKKNGTDGDNTAGVLFLRS